MSYENLYSLDIRTDDETKLELIKQIQKICDDRDIDFLFNNDGRSADYTTSDEIESIIRQFSINHQDLLFTLIRVGELPYDYEEISIMNGESDSIEGMVIYPRPEIYYTLDPNNQLTQLTKKELI